MALQQWIPLHFWPHANMVLVSFGQLFSKLEMAKTIRNFMSRCNECATVTANDRCNVVCLSTHFDIFVSNNTNFILV